MTNLTGLDVIVVGGGSLGICAAYFLQRAGMRVTLLGTASSDASVQGGGLGDVFTSRQTCDTTRLGLQLLTNIIGEIGYHIEGFDGACGVLMESVTTIRCPNSGADVLLTKLVADITDVIRDRGGRIFEAVEVLDIIVKTNQVVGVATSVGQFLSDEVVICTAGLSSELERRYGLDLGPTHHSIAAAWGEVSGEMNIPSSTPMEQGRYVGQFEEAGGTIIAVGHKLNLTLAMVMANQVSQMVARPWEYRKEARGVSFA